MSAAIVVDSVSKSFGATRALVDVSLEIRRGESRAVIGKNGAGKSTLMSILTGLESPDSGTVRVLTAEDRNDFSTVGCVYQSSTLVPAATAAENIALNSYPTRRGLINWKSVERRAVETLGEWGCAHLSDVPCEQLDLLERKIVEICRVLSFGPQVLLLDEPTAGLDRAATQHLFARIKAARNRGVSIIYVSHHLHEIFEVCESVTVLRDGRLVASDKLDDLTVDHLVEAMTGETGKPGRARRSPPRADKAPGAELPAVLVARSLTSAPKVDSVDLELRPGECVGLTGLDGAGHMQVAQILAGHLAVDSGTALLDGRPLPFGDIRGCMKAGVGCTPEDRHISGYVPGLSVAENATLSISSSFANRVRFINFSKRDKHYHALAESWSIKAHGPGQPIEELSGGNQQKVVLARSVAAAPRVLVLMNPTAGVDVSAKNSIYATVEDLKSAGKSVLIATSDDSDLEICDRVLVMFHGRIIDELVPPFSEKAIAAAVQGPAGSNGQRPSREDANRPEEGARP